MIGIKHDAKVQEREKWRKDSIKPLFQAAREMIERRYHKRDNSMQRVQTKNGEPLYSFFLAQLKNTTEKKVLFTLQSYKLFGV